MCRERCWAHPPRSKKMSTLSCDTIASENWQDTHVWPWGRKKVVFLRKNTNWTRQSLLVVFLLFFYFALHKNLAVTHAPIPSNWSNLIFLSQSLRPTSDPGVSLQDGCWSSIMLFSVLQTFTCCDLPWTKRNSADLTSSFGWCHRSPQESWPCWGPCCYGHN